ncbi:MAG: hypothetical protein HRT87_03165 [Legionellales bacterium]|nr:hypothetical protein [Legionellales bacterium]
MLKFLYNKIIIRHLSVLFLLSITTVAAKSWYMVPFYLSNELSENIRILKYTILYGGKKNTIKINYTLPPKQTLNIILLEYESIDKLFKINKNFIDFTLIIHFSNKLNINKQQDFIISKQYRVGNDPNGIGVEGDYAFIFSLVQENTKNYNMNLSIKCFKDKYIEILKNLKLNHATNELVPT